MILLLFNVLSRQNKEAEILLPFPSSESLLKQIYLLFLNYGFSDTDTR